MSNLPQKMEGSDSRADVLSKGYVQVQDVRFGKMPSKGGAMMKKPKCLNPCEVCEKDVEDDSLQYDRPQPWKNGERILLLWHRKCFEKKYSVKIQRKSAFKVEVGK